MPGTDQLVVGDTRRVRMCTPQTERSTDDGYCEDGTGIEFGAVRALDIEGRTPNHHDRQRFLLLCWKGNCGPWNHQRNKATFAGTGKRENVQQL